MVGILIFRSGCQKFIKYSWAPVRILNYLLKLCNSDEFSDILEGIYDSGSNYEEQFRVPVEIHDCNDNSPGITVRFSVTPVEIL